MESSTIAFLKQWWWVLVGIFLFIFVIAYINTPHQDSSETPKPKAWEKKNQRQIDSLLQANAKLQAITDSALAHGQLEYDAGLRDARAAMQLRQETHQKPTPQHEKVPATPASVKSLQQYYNDY